MEDYIIMANLPLKEKEMRNRINGDETVIRKFITIRFVDT